MTFPFHGGEELFLRGIYPIPAISVVAGVFLGISGRAMACRGTIWEGSFLGAVEGGGVDDCSWDCGDFAVGGEGVEFGTLWLGGGGEGGDGADGCAGVPAACVEGVEGFRFWGGWH